MTTHPDYPEMYEEIKAIGYNVWTGYFTPTEAEAEARKLAARFTDVVDLLDILSMIEFESERDEEPRFS